MSSFLSEENSVLAREIVDDRSDYDSVPVRDTFR